MFNRSGEMRVVSGIMPRKGSEVRGNVSARDDAVRALRNAVESFFAVFNVRLGEHVVSGEHDVCLKVWILDKFSVMRTGGS